MNLHDLFNKQNQMLKNTEFVRDYEELIKYFKERDRLQAPFNIAMLCFTFLSALCAIIAAIFSVLQFFA